MMKAKEPSPPLIGRDARWPPAAISSYFGWRQYTLHINPFIWRDIIPRRTLSRLDPYCHLKWQRYTAAQPKAFLTLGGDTRLRYEPTRYNQNAGNMGTPIFHD